MQEFSVEDLIQVFEEMLNRSIRCGFFSSRGIYWGNIMRYENHKKVDLPIFGRFYLTYIDTEHSFGRWFLVVLEYDLKWPSFQNPVEFYWLHPGCIPGTYQAILIPSTNAYLYAHNCAQNDLQNARKNPQNAPQIQESGKFV